MAPPLSVVQYLCSVTPSLTHSFIPSLTHSFIQAPRGIYLALYKPWPSPPGALILVDEEHTGAGESGAVGGASCGDVSGLGGPCAGLAGTCLGRSGKLHRRGDTELRKGRGSLSGCLGGKDTPDSGTARVGAKRLRSTGPVQGRALGLGWLENGVCVYWVEQEMRGEPGEAGTRAPSPCSPTNDAHRISLHMGRTTCAHSTPPLSIGF